MFHKITSRLLLLAGIPLFLAVALVTNLVIDRYTLVKEMDKLEPTTALGVQIGALIHEAQKERGATGGLLGSGANYFQAVLDEQRILTDERRSALENYLETLEIDHLDGEVAIALNKAVGEMRNIDGVRSRVDARSISGPASVKFYTDHNAAMLDVLKKSAILGKSPIIRQRRLAYLNLLTAKEQAGQERAVLSLAFSKDRFTGQSLKLFSGLVRGQDNFTEAFLAEATPEQVDHYTQTMSDPVMAEVQRIRDVVFTKIDNQAKVAKLFELQTNFGYGGAIHQFKNFILRQNPKYEKRFNEHYERMKKIIDELEAYPVMTDSERAHLAVVRGTIEQYRQATANARDMIEVGASVLAVDKAVKIDDGPAVKALTTLAQGASMGNFGIDPKHWFETITLKIDKLKKVEDKLAADLVASNGELRAEAQTALILLGLFAASIVGLITWAALMVIRGISRPMAKIIDSVRRVADGDLTTALDSDSKDELGELSLSLNHMIEKFRNSMKQVTEATEQLNATVQQTSSVNEDTNQAIQAQQDETTKMLKSVGKMTTMAQDAANNASGASQAAKDANNEARAGENSMQATVAQIQQVATEMEASCSVIAKLDHESKEIGTVLDVIKGISEQTNLLALNAAIEAARAGEQGRGFAVVADEVRTLASRTQTSAEEIHQMIDKLQSGAREAVEAIDRGTVKVKDSVEQAVATGANLTAITDAVSRMNDMNTQIAGAVAEQSAVVAEINRNIGQVNDKAEQTAGYSQQTVAVGSEVSQLSDNLQALVAQFRIS